MEDDDLQLSASTLSALQEFMQEKDARQKRFEELKSQAEADDEERKSAATGNAAAVTMEDFEADWNASQFWYDEGTSRALAEELVEGVGEDDHVALVSAPSVFVKLKNLMKDGLVPKCNIHLFEYDNRFALFGPEFTFYDFNEPLKLPLKFKGFFDRVLVDPPFLSEECQTKAAITVRWLAKSWAGIVGDNTGRPDAIGSRQQQQQRIIVCTGERMKDVVNKMYSKAGVRCTEFEVRHAQGLSNEFRCYANFESERLKWEKEI
ncbi:hypothetical protein TWF191_009067 [Orbilia oligospora]|uniref:Protein-lysine N-methyltransferase EFM5 n=1 Tax=Orbilia oligospora TaxID=2813651 RepID=A0A7C8UVQ3_ORBOL|nr:hypothetical protein TWF191_009067 [Orbilia oligospora]